MTWIDRLSLFQPLDYAAIGLLFLAWVLIGLRIESPRGQPSVSMLMARYRREWMRQMVSRDPRIFDSQILATLRQGTAFFASACMIAIGGTFALVGNADVVMGVASDLTLTNAPAIVWEIKLGVVIFLLTSAFLKFVWSNRLFGYCGVLLGAVPNDPNDPLAYLRAQQAADINITAARSFNRGLRGIYFGMAATAWLIGPIALIGATLITLGILLRREFASHSRTALLREIDETPNDQLRPSLSHAATINAPESKSTNQAGSNPT